MSAQTIKVHKNNTNTMSSNRRGSMSDVEDDGPAEHQEPIFTQISADMLGITLDTHGQELMEAIAREVLKTTCTLAGKWARHCSRKRVTVQDIENVLKYQQNMGSLKISSVDTLNMGLSQLTQVQGTSGSSALWTFQKSDIDVDKEDTETFVKIPRDIRVISYELVNEGQPVQSEYTVNVEDDDGNYYDKNGPEVKAPVQEKVLPPTHKTSCLQMFREAVKTAKVEQKVGLKPSTLEMLTVEQQLFMKDIITVCMGQDDKKRHEALHTLETDAGLQPSYMGEDVKRWHEALHALETDAGIQVFLPHLTERICKSISANISQRCLSLIIYAGRVLRSLSLNKACDMSVTLHHVLPSLLSCCVCRNMCLRPESDNHWALRDFSAKTLVTLVRDQVDKRDNGSTARRLFDFAHRTFRDPASSSAMVYGTINILQEFIVESNKKVTWLLAEFAETSQRCKATIESASRMNAPHMSVAEAAKLNQQIAKAEAGLRARFNIAATATAVPLNRRFL